MEESSVDWELCKENYQPLKSGRNTQALASGEEPVKSRAAQAEDKKKCE